MKHLVVVRGYNEPDNNTPSDEIWVRVDDFDPTFNGHDLEKKYEAEFDGDYANGTSVDYYPLAEVEGGWIKVSEIW